MMSGRVAKRPPRVNQSSERKALGAIINSEGLVADMPCTRCFRQRLECRMLEDRTRCGECSANGLSCDGVLVASNRGSSLRSFCFVY
jgi:hypothetical protein